MKPLIVGSRGSALALAQTKAMMAAVQACHPGLEMELKIIKTTGDAWALQTEPAPAPGKGLFTKELESALFAGEIDLAVHSLKDLPVDDAPGLALGAIPARADWRDVLITRDAFTLEILPRNAAVATGSPRRVRQLQHARPDLILSGIRGNIDTRLRKLRETPEWSGMILAAAGLERLKPEVTGLTLTPLEADTMLPAPGQGALGLQIRENDNATRASLAPVHDVVTAACVGAERAFLKGLGGGCSFPAGALAVCSNGREILLRAVAWLPRGDEWIMAGGEGQCVLDEAVELGEALAQRLKEGA